jgi:hypothetical protein
VLSFSGTANNAVITNTGFSQTPTSTSAYLSLFSSRVQHRASDHRAARPIRLGRYQSIQRDALERDGRTGTGNLRDAAGRSGVDGRGCTPPFGTRLIPVLGDHFGGGWA